MCLSIAINRPSDILAKGDHLGFEWMIIHNGMGSRCGYIKVPPGHLWHGQTMDQLSNLECHGGITFAEPDQECEAIGPDSGFWVGFDCAHGWDRPDFSLPFNRYGEDSKKLFRSFKQIYGDAMLGIVRTQEYVEAECRSLCMQAALAGPAAPLLCLPDRTGGPD